MLARIRDLFLNPTAVVVAAIAAFSFLVASYQLQAWPFGDRRTPRDRHHFARVSRIVLEPHLRAPGRVESSRRTIIRCELENMASTSTSPGGGASAASQSGGSSTMIWVIPEGTPVKKGDLIARLDASTYEEMLRQQTIVVEQARASHLQAQLDVEIARIALKEYLEGTVQETVESMEANLSLAKSNLTQAAQRLDWTKKMNNKGYASVAQIRTDEQTVMTSELTLQQQQSAYDLFRRFTLPKNEKSLRADITTAQTTLDSEQVKLNRQLERFALLKKQVERCTIRAPHDGVVYYYVDASGRRRPDQSADQIQEGMTVRQEQKLFFLPDLSEMEVQVILNESVVNRVGPGLPGRVEFEGLPDLMLTGKLVSISEIPAQSNSRGEDVRYFLGILKLDRSAVGLKPGMSAIVTLDLPRSEGVLAVPPDAVVNEEGRYACYLPAGDGDRLERREVKVGRTTPDLMEITAGLTEGEEIVLDPPARPAGRPRPLAGFEDRPWSSGPPAPLEEPAQDGPRNRRGLGGGTAKEGGNARAKGGRRSRPRPDAGE